MPEELSSSSLELNPGVVVDTLVVVIVSRSPSLLVRVTTAIWVEVTGLAVVRVSLSFAALVASSSLSLAVLLGSSLLWLLPPLLELLVGAGASFVD
jgi:hypothetical protein